MPRRGRIPDVRWFVSVYPGYQAVRDCPGSRQKRGVATPDRLRRPDRRTRVKANSRTRPTRLAMLLALAATLAMLLGMVGPSGASAPEGASPDKANCSTGRSVPVDKSPSSCGRSTGHRARRGRAARRARTGGNQRQRLEYVFAFLSDVGYRTQPTACTASPPRSRCAGREVRPQGAFAPHVHQRGDLGGEPRRCEGARPALGRLRRLRGAGIGSYENVLATAATLTGWASARSRTAPDRSSGTTTPPSSRRSTSTSRATERSRAPGRSCSRTPTRAG